MSQDAPVTKVWRKSINRYYIVETWKSGMHSVMPWPWTLTFWPQNLISSSLSRGAPVTKVWRKSVNRYWRYRGNIKLPRESRTDGRTHGRTHARTDGQRHGRTTRKHIASAGAYRRRRLKNDIVVKMHICKLLKSLILCRLNQIRHWCSDELRTSHRNSHGPNTILNHIKR